MKFGEASEKDRQEDRQKVLLRGHTGRWWFPENTIGPFC